MNQKQQNDQGYASGITNQRYENAQSAAWQAGWERGRRDMLDLIKRGFPV